MIIFSTNHNIIWKFTYFIYIYLRNYAMMSLRLCHVVVLLLNYSTQKAKIAYKLLNTKREKVYFCLLSAITFMLLKISDSDSG